MENIHLITNLQYMINYIEEHIEEDLTLEILSDICSISKYHLIRVFKNITDLTIMDYVRTRKLSQSLNELLNSNLNIIDIAIKYHFNYEQTYIRAFKQTFGITPSRFRKTPIVLDIVHPLNLELCIEFHNGILFKPKYVFRPEMKLIGLKDTVIIADNIPNNIANNLGVDFFYNHRGKIKHAINPNIYIGLTRDVSHDSHYNYYMPSLEVTDVFHVPEGMVYDIIPASQYAVFHYIGNHPKEEISKITMRNVYEYIYSTWIKLNNYDFLAEGGYHFEEIDTNIADINYCEAKIYFPIKSKQNWI